MVRAWGLDLWLPCVCADWMYGYRACMLIGCLVIVCAYGLDVLFFWCVRIGYVVIARACGLKLWLSCIQIGCAVIVRACGLDVCLSCVRIGCVVIVREDWMCGYRACVRAAGCVRRSARCAGLLRGRTCCANLILMCY